VAAGGRTWKDGLGELWTERRGGLTVRVRRLVVPDAVAREVEVDLAAASSLDHKAMVRIIGVTSHPEGLEIVTEAGVGVPLRKFLGVLSEHNEKLAVSHATWIALQVMDLLAVAQARMDAGKLAPVVHGRLSPGHILLTSAGEVRVTGFGLDAAARHLIEPSVPLDRTFGYVAPEQRDGARPRPESDVFALGSILAEMIQGSPVFVGRTMAETLGAVGMRMAPHLRAKRPEVPLALDEALAWCLDKTADKRPRAEAALVRLSAFQGMLDAGDRIRPNEHPAKLADLLRLRMGTAEVVDWPTDLLDAPEADAPQPKVVDKTARPRRVRASRVLLALLAALGAWSLVLAVRWQTMGPRVLAAVPAQWRPRVEALLPPLVADAGVEVAAPQAMDAGPALALVPVDAGPPPAAAPKTLLTIKASAPGRVLLDGNDVGAAPVTELDVQPGAHRLELVGPRAKVRAVEHVMLQPGDRKTLVLRSRRKER
jgi:hypothetical protein